jgi:transglutaminase-like putative cysteine protease
MRLKVQHTTAFIYDAPIVEATTELRLRPLDTGGQRCISFRLETEPRGVRVHEFADHLGNAVGHFDVLEPHDRLTVTATSEVLTATYDDRGPLSPLELHDYLAETEYAHLEAPLPAAPRTTGATAAERATELMREVAAALVYEKGATSVQTSAPEVLALGRGVCQDFAHVLIAACRLDGVPARYVSGYLHADSFSSEHGASHAWVDIWDDVRGWVSLDPTHGCEQGESYVRVATGRDYGDVPPTRGVFKGQAEETLAVAVVVDAVK